MHIILFFTYGVSVKLWDETGLLDRELLIYKRLIKDGHKVTLITYGDQEDLNFQDKTEGISVIPVYKYLRRPGNSFIRFIHSFFIPFRLKIFLKDGDIYKTNQMFGSWVAIISKLLYKKKLVVKCGYEFLRNHGIRGDYNFFKKSLFFIFGYLLEAISYLVADCVIITSLSNYEFIKRCFLFNHHKLKVVRNYIDMDLFKPQITAKTCDLLYIGRITQCKNLLNLLDGLKGLDRKLTIIGKGELADTLETISKENKINLEMKGVVPNNELPEHINKAKIFILPSFYENSPKSLLEAMSCGAAVIGADVDGIRELITHKENGYLCQTDSESIRNAITELMADEKLRRELGKSAREFILENCNLKNIYKRELGLYEDML
ncbi:MAG: glycosyltransferase family 4 protein [bacterium]|nr:glycosyltransferase family 4 protein [bacterium]